MGEKEEPIRLSQKKRCLWPKRVSLCPHLTFKILVSENRGISIGTMVKLYLRKQRKKIALANTGKSYNKGIPSPKKMKIEILDMENNVVKTFDSQLEMLRGLKVGYPRGQALLKGEELFIDTNNLLKAEEGKPREYKCRKV